MSHSVIIVGAGISGLSAACYARMNGIEAKIFEMHTIPGGLCTAWERMGYKFDISMHMVTASQDGPLHRMWKELGITDNFKFHYHNSMSQVEGQGRKLTFHTDRKKLEDELIAMSPEDKPLIREFISLIFGPDLMKAASLKPMEMQNIFDKIRVLPVILPHIRNFIRYNNVTIQQFASRFKDPFLREAIRFYIDAPGWPMPDFPFSILAGFMKAAVTEAGAPLGGSQQVVFHMAIMFKKFGGEIQYKSRVKELIIENNCVIGVRMEDGAEHFADTVIWTGDGHHLIYDILQGKYLNKDIENMYNNWIPVKPILHVMLGVDMDLSDKPNRLIFEADEAIMIAGKEHRWLAALHHCFDKSMAPEGKSAVEIWYDTEYDYWEELAKDRKAYENEKKRIADYSIQQLEKRWPGIASRVEVVDVPTPVTYKRYTGNWKGSPDGWYVTKDNMQKMEPLRLLPGLKGLKMAGQWTMPFTGTVMAALTGRQAIQLICREKGIHFHSSIEKWMQVTV